MVKICLPDKLVGEFRRINMNLILWNSPTNLSGRHIFTIPQMFGGFVELILWRNWCICWKVCIFLDIGLFYIEFSHSTLQIISWPSKNNKLIFITLIPNLYLICLFLIWVTFGCWRWEQYILSKHQVTFTRLHGVISRRCPTELALTNCQFAHSPSSEPSHNFNTMLPFLCLMIAVYGTLPKPVSALICWELSSPTIWVLLSSIVQVF
jgi:hypothetical protein